MPAMSALREIQNQLPCVSTSSQNEPSSYPASQPPKNVRKRLQYRASRAHYTSQKKKNALVMARQARCKENLPPASVVSPLSQSEVRPGTQQFHAFVESSHEELQLSHNLDTEVSPTTRQLVPAVESPQAELSRGFDAEAASPQASVQNVDDEVSLDTEQPALPATESDSELFSAPNHELSTRTCTIDGSRILNISELAKSMQEMTAHSASCSGMCELHGETRSGLSSILSAQCSTCHHVFHIHSSTRTAVAIGRRKCWTINLAAVLGQMSSGGGLTRLNSTLALLDIPGMHKRTYSAIEEFLGDTMKQQLIETMKEAAELEKQHAIATNSYHQGVPAITVVVDGGWSKRSHKHSYNAKSGVAIIFGAHTKKILVLGVRNKFCSICAVAMNKKKEPPNHRCYRNWAGSSGAMETDIIVEGFCQSERSHGLRYIRVIGDGDSSVMATIRTSVPYGMFVEKLECANHACKCYRNRLEALSKDHPEFRGKGGLTKRVMQRLTVGARISIRRHSQTGNVEKLRHDLRNGPAHVFGDHSNCDPQFCKHVPSSMDTSSVSEEDDTVSDEDFSQVEPTDFVEQLEAIISEEQADEITAEAEDDAMRGGNESILSALPSGLYAKVLACGDRLVVLTPQLIQNQTSNLAECYMSVRCSFDGGKYFNKVQRGSFEHSCYGAGLRIQNGPQWSISLWNEATGREPGEILQQSLGRKEKQVEADQKRKKSEDYKARRKAARYPSEPSSIAIVRSDCLHPWQMRILPVINFK